MCAEVVIVHRTISGKPDFGNIFVTCKQVLLMRSWRKVVALFLGLLLFAGQSGYSFTLCYCARENHLHIEWPWGGSGCCREEADEDADSSVLCEFPGSALSCCAYSSNLREKSCCEHTTLIIKKTDPATSQSLNKSLSFRKDFASGSTDSFAFRGTDIVLSPFGLREWLHKVSRCCPAGHSYQTFICVWRK